MVLSYWQAREEILSKVELLSIERVALLEAAGRAIAEDVIAPHALPAFDNSAMDGYAVRAQDCVPGKTLQVAGYVPAGEQPEAQVLQDAAIKIMTGAPIPAGADAVVPYEQTEENPDQIRLLAEVSRGAHIRRQGEDIQPGIRVLAAGSLLRPAEISLLASFGMSLVPVHRRVRVAILATGDELQEIDELKFAGGIVNSNSWALAAAVQEIGGVPLVLGIARDNKESLRDKLLDGLQADVLVTTAGVSAGDRDLVREVLAELGVQQQFWKINIKPGFPTAFSLYGSTPIFSLPGNPVSTQITFEEFVRPALLKMMGHSSRLKPLFKARLRNAFKKKPGRLQLLRVTVALDENGEIEIESAGDQNTGILTTLLKAQGIALLPEEKGEFCAGELVDVHLLGAATGFGA